MIYVKVPSRCAAHFHSCLVPICGALKGPTSMMKVLRCASPATAMLLACAIGWSQVAHDSLQVHWDEGAENCTASSKAPIQVHAYDAQTFVLRENLCTTFEGNFLYLLVGSSKALLIDTGDVADPNKMPLARTVTGLLPNEGASKLPLLVVHTHRHQDHRAGDPQFVHLPNVQIIGYDLRSVQQYFGIADWPNGLAQIDLGDRTVDVIPTPGHEETHISFYDRNTGLFFSGDFLMPGRLVIDDAAADLASAKRVANFVKDRPVSYVLGGHIELNLAGELFPSGSQFHPGERPLQMSKADLLALPAAVGSFNDFYTKHGNFTLVNPMHNLIAIVLTGIIALLCVVAWLVRHLQRRQAAPRPRDAVR
jgi:hydroxyacylglutathione hydrolase